MTPFYPPPAPPRDRWRISRCGHDKSSSLTELKVQIQGLGQLAKGALAGHQPDCDEGAFEAADRQT